MSTSLSARLWKAWSGPPSPRAGNRPARPVSPNPAVDAVKEKMYNN